MRSVRFTLTLWYVGILAFILCLFSAALYTIMATNLSRDMSNTLVLQADGMAGALQSFWEAERVSQGNWQYSPPPTFQGLIELGGLPELAKRWAEKTGSPEAGQLVRLMDRSGRALVVSPGFGQLAFPLSKNKLEKLRQRHTLFETFRRSRKTFRVVTHPVVESGRTLYFVQVAAPLTRMEVSLRRLLLWLLLLVPLTLAMTSAVGWFLARIALRPVAQMIAQVRQISAKALDKRVDVLHTGDEVEELAETFNDMLVRLERGFRRLRQFSAAASHELRTPLTVMKGELEVTLRKPRDPEEYRRTLVTHLSTIDEISRTVEELLTLAHSEAADGALEWHPVELNALVQQASETWQKVANDKGISLELPSQQPVWVRGEKRLLSRLVSNLLDNAIRYSPTGGKVSVRAEQWRNKACLLVQDTGPGIPPGEIPDIFDRFFKSSSPRGTLSTGLGLGLCRWIAEIHHGRIEVASPPGQGAAFTVWFPLLASPAV